MDSKIGFAAFMHPKRNCVYDEAKTILALGKDTKNNINRHLQHLYDSKMPENYGDVYKRQLVHTITIPALAMAAIVCQKILSSYWRITQMCLKI